MDLCTTAPSQQILNVVQQMQLLLQLWAGLLQATRGALKPEKFFWYLINQTWTNTGLHYDQPGPKYHLQIQDDMGKMITTPHLSPSKAWHTIQSALDGNI